MVQHEFAVDHGLFQMSVNPHYDGFLSISTQWSLAILTKHLLGIVMVVVSAIQTWEVIPAIRRRSSARRKAEILMNRIPCESAELFSCE